MITNKHGKGEQELIGPKTYWKRPNRKTCEGKNKTNKKLGFLDNGIMHFKIGLRMHNQACVRKLDHACAYPCLENPENVET